MRQTTAQSRHLFASDNTDAESEVIRSAGCVGARSGSSAYLRHRRLGGYHAYTLIEVLIVASIVVLMLGMALPVFHAITGSRSEAGASNIIASMLSRARTDAIGLDKPMGVAFLYSESKQQSFMAEVYFPDHPAWVLTSAYNPGDCVKYSLTPAGQSPYFCCLQPVPANSASLLPNTSPAYWAQVGGPPLEISPDTELQPLPTGIGVQTICNCNFNTASPPARVSNGYLSFGVILFDGNGRIVSQPYGVSHASKLMTLSQLAADYPLPNTSPAIYTPTDYGVSSQYGLVVFQQEAFLTQRAGKRPEALYTDSTPASSNSPLPSYNNSATLPTQKAQEDWLDTNSTPLLIDRYTGTLIRGD